MGRLNLSELPEWERDHGLSIIDPDISLPIGRRKAIDRQDATLVHVDEKSFRVVYGPEVKLYLLEGTLPLPPKLRSSVAAVKSLLGYLAFTDKTEYRKHTVVVAALPASQNWHLKGRLERAAHRMKDQIVERIRKLLQEQEPGDPIDALQEAISRLPFQPFETRTNWISTWLIAPQSVEDLAITQRRGRGQKTLAEEYIPARRKQDLGQPEWGFGLCKDIERCIDVLRIDPQIKKLLLQTEDGELFLNYRNTGSGGRGPVARWLKAIAVDCKQHVLDAAIMTALAGIDESIYAGCSPGKPRFVARQVEIYYREIMYNLVRRLPMDVDVTPPQKSNDWPDKEPAAPSVGLSTVDERVELLRAAFRRLDKITVFSKLEQGITNGENSDDELAFSIVAIPPDWQLTQPLREWLRKKSGSAWENAELGRLVKQRLSLEDGVARGVS